MPPNPKQPKKQPQPAPAEAHTPTPWYQINEDYDGQISIRSEETDEEVATIHYGDDDGIHESNNADFILRAVNAHDELVEALREAQHYLAKTKYAFMDDIRAALRKAQGGKV